MYDEQGNPKYKSTEDIQFENESLTKRLNRRDEMIFHYMDKVERHRLESRVWMSLALTLLASLIVSLVFL